MQTELSNSFIKIRRYGTADIPLLFEAARESVANGSRWLPWLHQDYSMAESLEWVVDCRKQWDQGREYSFAIVDPLTDQFLGRRWVKSNQQYLPNGQPWLLGQIQLHGPRSGDSRDTTDRSIRICSPQPSTARDSD